MAVADDATGWRVRIFVAGCARSGTTLMQELMATYDDTHVEPGEHPPSRLDFVCARSRNVVVKRDSTGYRHLEALPASVHVVYMVRHPYDVLTSYHPRTKSRGYHVTPERWLSEYEAWGRIRGRARTMVVRYEDLVRLPAAVSGMLGTWGLRPIDAFGQAPAPYTHAIGRWARDPTSAKYIEDMAPELRRVVREFCEEFRYGVMAA